LLNLSIDFEGIPGLSDVFKEDNTATKPFHKQEKYFKGNFHLKLFEEYA
jgi:hypothetical protein